MSPEQLADMGRMAQGFMGGNGMPPGMGGVPPGMGGFPPGGAFPGAGGVPPQGADRNAAYMPADQPNQPNLSDE